MAYRQDATMRLHEFVEAHRACPGDRVAYPLSDHDFCMVTCEADRTWWQGNPSDPMRIGATFVPA